VGVFAAAAAAGEESCRHLKVKVAENEMDQFAGQTPKALGWHFVHFLVVVG